MPNIIDIAFNIFTAYFQIIMLLVGAGMMVIAGAITVSKYQSRRSPQRWLNGRIVALREGKGITDTDGVQSTVYYPVIEATDDNGHPVRYETETGYGNINALQIGMWKRIQPMPDKPGFARMEGDGKIDFFIVIFLAAMGGALAYMALQVVPFSTWSIPVWVLTLIWILFKFAGSLKPKHLRETVAAFRERKNIEYLAKRQAMPEVTSADVNMKMQRLMPIARVINTVGILVGFGLLCLGGLGYNAQQEFIASSKQIAVSPCPNMALGEDCRRNFLPIDTLSMLPFAWRPPMQGIYRSPRPSDSIPLIVDYGPWTPVPFYILMSMGAVIILSNLRARANLGDKKAG